MVTPQHIRAEGDSVSVVVLRLPVPADTRASRKMGFGDRTLDVKISEHDRDRGYVEITFYNYMSCVSFTAEHEWCSLRWVACFDDGICVEL